MQKEKRINKIVKFYTILQNKGSVIFYREGGPLEIFKVL